MLSRPSNLFLLCKEQIWPRLLKPLFSMFIRFLMYVICLVKGLYTYVTQDLKNTIHHSDITHLDKVWLMLWQESTQIDYDPKCLMPLIFYLAHTRKAATLTN